MEERGKRALAYTTLISVGLTWLVPLSHGHKHTHTHTHTRTLSLSPPPTLHGSTHTHSHLSRSLSHSSRINGVAST